MFLCNMFGLETLINPMNIEQSGFSKNHPLFDFANLCNESFHQILYFQIVSLNVQTNAVVTFYCHELWWLPWTEEWRRESNWTNHGNFEEIRGYFSHQEKTIGEISYWSGDSSSQVNWLIISVWLPLAAARNSTGLKLILKRSDLDIIREQQNQTICNF